MDFDKWFWNGFLWDINIKVHCIKYEANILVTEMASQLLEGLKNKIQYLILCCLFVVGVQFKIAKKDKSMPSF